MCLSAPRVASITPSATSKMERESACQAMPKNDCPCSRRFEYEKGAAMPTMNMKLGWIRSHKEQPCQS